MTKTTRTRKAKPGDTVTAQATPYHVHAAPTAPVIGAPTPARALEIVRRYWGPDRGEVITMARIPAPTAPLAAYCFLCTRSLVGPNGAPLEAASGNREGACDECRAEIKVHLAPTAPSGAPMVPSPRLAAPAELATEATEAHTVARPGWLVTDRRGEVIGWARTRELARALKEAADA